MPDCIFCKIISGQIPADVFYSDDRVLAIRDIQPIAKGHVVVMYKTHHEHTKDLNPKDQAYLFTKTVELAEQVKAETKAEAYNLLIFDGEAAESAVPHRPHIHIVPRNKNDGIKIDPR